MSLNKLEQELKGDLRGLASDFKWSAVELKQVADRLSLVGNEADAQALRKMCVVLRAGEDRLTAYAEEVNLGQIARAKAE